MRAKIFLQQAIQNDRVAHAYLLEGPSATANKEIAKDFAKALLCQENKHSNQAGASDSTNNSQSGTPCNTCQSCRMFQQASHPDFHLLEVEGETIKIREHMTPFFQDIRLSSYSGRKVYIIADAEKMNAASQNSILKTLEEPVQGVTIILLTTNSNALLPTILSRVVRYPVSEEAVPFGQMDKEYQDAFFHTIEQIESAKPSARIGLANDWANKKETLPALLDTLQQYYRNSLVEKYTGNPMLLNVPKTDKISANGAIAAMRYIDEFRFALKSNANVQLAADVFLTKLTDAYIQA